MAKQPSAISMPPAKVEVAVEEARKTPVILRLPITEEEAEEINPARLAKPPTVRVEEALNGPLTKRFEEKVEDAVDKTPDKVERLEAVIVPVAVKFAVIRFPEIIALP